MTEDMGVNLAGAEVALKLMARIEELERENLHLNETVASLRQDKYHRDPLPA